MNHDVDLSSEELEMYINSFLDEEITKDCQIDIINVVNHFYDS